MAKQRSQEEREYLVEGADMAAEIWRKLRREATDLGVPKMRFHTLATPEGDEVIADMAKVMQKAWGLPTYAITVDYSQTVEQMVAALRCDGHINSNINTANFGKEIAVKKGAKEDLKVVLFHLNRAATSGEVLAEMEKKGLHSATAAELLTFGAQYPDIQREFPIVSLGSSCVLRGDRQVASLWSNASRRSLNLHYFGPRWPAHYRFLAVSK